MGSDYCHLIHSAGVKQAIQRETSADTGTGQHIFVLEKRGDIMPVRKEGLKRLNFGV